MNQETAMSITLDQLIDCAEHNKSKVDIASAFGEIEIAGVYYQMQISLISDKRIWVKDDEVRFQEVTKIL